MNSALKRYSGIVIFSLLSACAGTLPQRDRCVGDITATPDGLAETTDQALLAAAIGAPTKGALCKGKVFVVEKEVTVYRVWDAGKSYSRYGSWWSLALPTGPRDAYQLNNAICPEWSALDTMSACTVKIGSKIVVGPGQSAQCTDALLPSSAINQVYIPNNSDNHGLLVENCGAGEAWPVPAR